MRIRTGTRSKLTRLGGWVAAGAIGAYACPVQAEQPEAPSDEAVPVMTGELSVGAFAESRPDVETAAVAPRARLGIRVRPEVELDLDVGLATLHQRRDGEVVREARPSNLGFGFRFIRERRKDWFRKAWAGFEFALPTTFVDGEQDRTVFDYAIGSGGGWSPWTWEPATLALVVPAGWQSEVAPKFELGFEGAVAGLFAAGLNPAPPAFAGQAAGQVRYAFPWLGLGLRAQAVYNGRQPDDKSQFAVAPSIDTALCRQQAKRRIQGVVGGQSADCPVSLSARVHVNIDQPYGFVTDEAMRVWGLQIGLGWAVF